MFVWTAIDIESQLSELKSLKSKIEEKLGIFDSVVNLPLHISLKISFEVSDSLYQQVIDAILDYYKSLNKFEIMTKGISREGSIIWLEMHPNASLEKLHLDLMSTMQSRFAIHPHKFDLEFKYHTTLFFGLSDEKLFEAEKLLEYAQIPKKVTADHLVIGSSESGAPGTYRVTHNIML